MIQTGENEFIVAGTGVVITFTADDKHDPLVGIPQAEEGVYVNGQ